MALPVLTADLVMHLLNLLLERLQQGRAWWLEAPSIFCAGAAVGAVGATVNAGAVAVVAAIEAAAAAKQAQLAAEAAKVAVEAAGPEGAMAALAAAAAASAAAVEAETAAAMTVPESEVCVINASPDDLHRWFLPPATSGSFSSLPSSSSGGRPLLVLGTALGTPAEAGQWQHKYRHSDERHHTWPACRPSDSRQATAARAAAAALWSDGLRHLWHTRQPPCRACRETTS